MAKFNLLLAKAILARIMFILHALVCMFRVHTQNHELVYFVLLVPLVILLIEAYFTLKLKHGEWKWFCPSVFLYLSSVIPAMWFVELDLYDLRLSHLNGTNHSDQFTSPDGNHQAQALNIEGWLIPVSFSPEGWAKVLEQLLLLILIVGRWMLPKGKITRDQLSQLLLVYIGMAADILELFEAFKEEAVMTNMNLTVWILGCWSVSVLQFSLVITSVRQFKKTAKCQIPHCYCFETEIWAIITTCIMQDIPFLVLRMTLIVRYKVLSYMNIFFTCKNWLVTLLQLYRVFTLCHERKTKSKIPRRRRNVSMRYTKSGVTLTCDNESQTTPKLEFDAWPYGQDPLVILPAVVDSIILDETRETIYNDQDDLPITPILRPKYEESNSMEPILRPRYDTSHSMENSIGSTHAYERPVARLSHGSSSGNEEGMQPPKSPAPLATIASLDNLSRGLSLDSPTQGCEVDDYHHVFLLES
ncbi:transmembrane protein 26-like [Lineus longissimus]|uniref:transmembrane protein 26-like n=1 Tax=Lineus longissimus TaxID=88925 RepID=UPI00315D468B